MTYEFKITFVSGPFGAMMAPIEGATSDLSYGEHGVFVFTPTGKLFFPYAVILKIETKGAA